MSGTPVSVIEEEDEDVTTASASLTSEATRTSLQTALKGPGHGQPGADGQEVGGGDRLPEIGNHPSTSGTVSTNQDTTLTGASSDLPLDDDPSSGTDCQLTSFAN